MSALLQKRFPFVAPQAGIVLDHLVIGGGVVGCAIAHRLATRLPDRSTYLVERSAVRFASPKLSSGTDQASPHADTPILGKRRGELSDSSSPLPVAERRTTPTARATPR